MTKMERLLAEARDAATLDEAIALLVAAGIDEDRAEMYARLERGEGGEDHIILDAPD